VDLKDHHKPARGPAHRDQCELLKDDINRSIELVGPQHGQSDRSRHEVCQLQSFGVGFFVCDHQFEADTALLVTRLVTQALELLG
jgi:hypothetical protein